MKSKLFKYFSKYLFKNKSESVNENPQEFNFIAFKTFTFLAAIIFLINSILEAIEIQYISTIILLLVSIYFFYFTFSKRKEHTSSYAFLLFFFLSLVIFFYSSKLGFEAGIELYYIPLLFSFPYFLKRNLYLKVILIILIILEIAVNQYTNYKLFKCKVYTIEIKQERLFIAIISITIYSLISFFFTSIIRNIGLHLIIKDTSESKNATPLTNNAWLFEKKIETLNELAKNKNQSFFLKFTQLFPEFINNIKLSHPSLNQAEIEILLFLKINYTTKEIASLTNSTIRAIESKKYRIRKKLSLTSNEDLSDWIINYCKSNNY